MDFSLDWVVMGYSIVAFLSICVGLTVLILLTRSIFAPKGVCTITINDDSSLTKRVASGQTLLNALSKEGIILPSPCGGRATCKQCKLRVLGGGEAPLDTDIAAFTKRQLQDGWRLSCQVKVHHDLSVHIDEKLLNVKQYRAHVVSNYNVATFIKELVLQLAPEEHIEYRPGAYMQMVIPPFRIRTDEWKGGIDASYWPDWDHFGMFGESLDFSKHSQELRAYSFGSYPAEGNVLKFNVRIATPPFEGGKVSRTIPWGFGSSYLFSLKAGDSVQLLGPYGESFMRHDKRDLYFLIGGAGSSFGRSHILDLFRSKKTNQKVSMWYGARSLKENIYQADYEALVKDFPNFSYHLVLSEPTKEDIEAGWPAKDPLKTAFLFKAFEAGQLKGMEAPEENLYYVCGPPMHNKSVMKLLDDYGVPRENIVLDDFGS